MFHVHAFNPHPLLRQCVDSYLIVSVDQQEGYIENNLLPHITQSLVFGLDRGQYLYTIVTVQNSVPLILLPGPMIQSAAYGFFPE